MKNWSWNWALVWLIVGGLFVAFLWVYLQGPSAFVAR
jgi:hypothetical protein